MKCKARQVSGPRHKLCDKCRLTQTQRKKLMSQCIDCIEVYNDPNHYCRHPNFDTDQYIELDSVDDIIDIEPEPDIKEKFKIVIPVCHW